MSIAIEEIIEAAVNWISEDADHPDTPPDTWQAVIPLLKAAPELAESLETMLREVAAWRGGLNTQRGYRCLHEARVGASFGDTAKARAILAGAKEAARLLRPEAPSQPTN